MIQELSGLNGKSVLSEVSNHQIEQGSPIQNKDALLALSKIQVGDVISGKVILEQNQTMLKLQSGLTLLAHLPKPILSDQFLDFLVVGKERQHLELEQIQVNESGHLGKGIEEAVIKEMQLPNNPEMKQVVSKWMDQQLPLLKNQMLQLYHLAKQYELPSEALVNLKGQQAQVSKQEVAMISELKKDGMMWVDRLIRGVFDEMNEQQLVQFNKALGEHFLPNQLEDILKNLKITSSGSLQEMPLMQQKKMDNTVGLEQESQTMTSAQMEKPLTNHMTNIGADTIPIKNNLQSTFEVVLQAASKDHLKVLAKALVDQYLQVDFDKVTPKSDELFKLEEASERLKRVVETVKQQIGQEISSPQLEQLNQASETLDKFNLQGQYYCFPLQIKEQKTSGELYFYKPKKHKKGEKQTQGMYIVLALDMPSLKHIEIHLSEQKETLSLKMKVDNEMIQKQMEAHETKLRKLMEDSTLPIGMISIECTKVVQKEPSTTTDNQFSRLDFRI